MFMEAYEGARGRHQLMGSLVTSCSGDKYHKDSHWEVPPHLRGLSCLGSKEIVYWEIIIEPHSAV